MPGETTGLASAGSGGASPSVTSAPADSADFFLALVLSLLAILLFLFAALVIICCLYRRSNRRRRRREAGEDFDPYLHDALVTKKHVPVIFAEELDDSRLWPPAGAASTSGQSGGGGSGGPLVLPDEKPPVRMPDDVELDGGGGAALPDLQAGFERLRYGNKPAPPPP